MDGRDIVTGIFGEVVGETMYDWAGLFLWVIFMIAKSEEDAS